MEGGPHPRPVCPLPRPLPRCGEGGGLSPDLGLECSAGRVPWCPRKTQWLTALAISIRALVSTSSAPSRHDGEPPSLAAAGEGADRTGEGQEPECPLRWHLDPRPQLPQEPELV